MLTVDVPPLRARGSDLLLLAQRFVERAARGSGRKVVGLPSAAAERICDYRRSDVLIASQDPSELVSLAEVERRYILRVLESVGGNRTLAARILGLDRRTLYRKLERWTPTGVA